MASQPEAANPSASEKAAIVDKLNATPMFRYCNKDDLKSLAARMRRIQFKQYDYMVEQDKPVDNLLVLSSGETRRTRLGRDGVERHILDADDTYNALTVTSGDPAYAAAKCISESCSVFALQRSQFRAQLESQPQLATDVVQSLSEEVRAQRLRFRTPFLATRSNEVNYAAVAVASTVESYYRSALNAILTRQLTGNSSIPLFPSMHVQVPARVAYITGFKSLRAYFDQNVDPDAFKYPSFTRLATAISPGLLMTPVSSILEACNVGHVNPEPLMRRCTRGFVPRGGREVIFGVGLNQMSDYFEERFRTLNINPVLANSLGSITAGVASGYLSHVPHNISTLKMLHPEKTYGQLFQTLIEKSPAPAFLTRAMPHPVANIVRSTWACLVPKGVFTRTVQICGSFVILNGLILLIEGDNRRRMRQALEASEKEESVERSYSKPKQS